MKTSLLSRHLLLILLAGSAGACGLGAAPKAVPVEDIEAPVVEDEVDDDVVIIPDAEEDVYDGPDESLLQKQLARNAAKRKQLLAEMDSHPTWREKYAVSSRWTTSLDYQTWKPRKKFKDEVFEREALLDLAVREFLTNWEYQSRDIRKGDRAQMDVFSQGTGVQNMVAIALAMDQRNHVQDKYAKRYGFELFSVFGLLRDTLIKKKHLDPQNEYESTIANHVESAIEALEWRMNAYLLWSWELMFMETLNPGFFENKTLKIEKLNVDQMKSAISFLNRANVAAEQLTKIRAALTEEDQRYLRLNQKIKFYYAQMDYERAVKTAAKEKDAQKRQVANQLLTELHKTLTWMSK